MGDRWKSPVPSFGDHARAIRCRLCGVVMRDHEPCQGNGCFYHPGGPLDELVFAPRIVYCRNAGKVLRMEPDSRRRVRGTPGIQPMWEKSYRRARRRGARQARKFRPKGA